MELKTYQPLLKDLPETPGVYLFKDKKGQVIYVGKGLNLKKRVESHFRQTASASDFKKPLMISQVVSLDFILVQSEIEALLLEANLIKKNQPRYNTRLKDDKSYLYIKITVNDDFPKVLTARREKIPGADYKAQYFGPFPSTKTVRNTLRALRRIFPYCNCNFRRCQKKQSCFWSEIGLDAGPCLGLISKYEYHQIIKGLLLLLQGQKEKLLHKLTRAMIAAAKKEEFEKAQNIKRQITGIEYLTRPAISPHVYLENPEYLAEERQVGLKTLKKILFLDKIPQRIECFDISDLHGRQATGSMVVFQKGQADKSQYRRFKVRPLGGEEGQPNDVAMMKEIVRRRLAHQEWLSAELMIVDGGKGQVSGVLEVLREARLTIPLIGLAKKREEIIIALASTQARRIGGRSITPHFEILRLPSDSPAIHLLQAIRDEAHRFALTYHRKLRLEGLRG